MPTTLPPTQYAVQLVGPGKLTLNTSKPVTRPGPHQILARVECVGLCFSDLKLLKQFSQHPRKGEVVSGLPAEALKEMPHYVPGDKPTVPGHEVTARIVAVGDKAKHHKVGQRVLVQTDYRDLPTAGSNAAFGYNFEGGLQEYVLMDERVIMDRKTGESFLIDAPENLSASAIALVEPWACVEDSYVSPERRTVKAGGKMLLVADSGHKVLGLREALAGHEPAQITAFCAQETQQKALLSLGVNVVDAADLAGLPNEGFDDILYFGARKPALDVLNDKLAARAILNIVTGGQRIGQPVSVGIGRVHYGATRWIGTTGGNAAEAYAAIPATGELRPGERVVVIGAGGPMGQMHVIRTVCSGVAGVSVVGTDVDDGRIEALRKKAAPLAKANRVELRLVNTQKEALPGKFTYHALMAPVGALLAQAVTNSADRCLINIFAGIPAPTRQDLDLDTYLANRCFMFGTSGSVIRDMKIVLSKVKTGRLDTNTSVDAICGMAGATDGLAAVENRTLAGKILVYPQLHDAGLIPLSELHQHYPAAAAKLRDGQWCKAAEDELLREAGAPKA